MVQLKHNWLPSPSTRGFSCGKEASSQRKALECEECAGTSSRAQDGGGLGSLGRWGHFPSHLRATGELIPDITFWHWGQASASSKLSQVLRLGVLEPLLGSAWPLNQPISSTSTLGSGLGPVQGMVWREKPG